MIAGIFFGENLCEASLIDSLILQDLKGVKLYLRYNEDVAKQLGIDSKNLKKRFEEQLEKSAINLYKKETSEYFLTGRPSLEIDIRILKSKDSSFDCLVDTSFMLTLRTFSNPKATKRASIATWSAYRESGTLNDILDIIDMQVDSFVMAVCKSKKGGICNSQHKMK
jgi:hypothetical protein